VENVYAPEAADAEGAGAPPLGPAAEAAGGAEEELRVCLWGTHYWSTRAVGARASEDSGAEGGTGGGESESGGSVGEGSAGAIESENE